MESPGCLDVYTFQTARGWNERPGGQFQMALDHHLENTQFQIMKTHTWAQFSCLCSFQRSPHFLMNAENGVLRETPNHIIIKSHRGVAGLWPQRFLFHQLHTQRLKLPPHRSYPSWAIQLKNHIQNVCYAEQHLKLVACCNFHLRWGRLRK